MIKTLFVFLLYAVEAVIVTNYFHCVFQRRRSAAVTAVSVCVGYAVLFGVYFLNNPAVNFTVFTGINLGLLLLNYSCKVWSAIFHSAVLSLFMFLSELILLFFSAAWGKATGTPSDSVYALVLDAALSKLIFLILCQIAARVAVRENKGLKFPPRSLGLYLLPLVTFILLNAIYRLSVEERLPAQYDATLCLSSILLMFANIVVFMIYESLIQSSRKMTELQLAAQKETIDHAYYSILQEQYENSRMLVHDIKNHLTAIDTLACGPNPAEVHDYVQSIYEHYQLSSRLPFSGNRMMDVICNQKQTQCAREGIAITFRNEGVRLDFMNDVDLCALLGNLLDNAIESCRASAGKSIAVSFYRKNDTFLVISMQNSCDRRPQVRNHRLVSRKKDCAAHGIGMLSIEKSIKKYHGTMDYYYEEDKKIFHTNIIFPASVQKKAAQNSMLKN